jgi:Ca2+-binding EF-hand superfamily protein
MASTTNTSQKNKQRLQAVFKMDTDNSGSIDKKEYIEALKVLNIPSEMAAMVCWISSMDRQTLFAISRTLSDFFILIFPLF